MNINTSLAIDFAILLTLAFGLLWTLYLRSNRKVLLQKYKRDKYSLKGVEKMLSNKRLIITCSVLVLTALKTVSDVRNIFRLYGDLAKGKILFDFAFTLLVFAITIAVIFYVFKKNSTIIKP